MSYEDLLMEAEQTGLSVKELPLVSSNGRCKGRRIEAINLYREKYGLYATVDNYVIYFEPYLGVAKLF